MDFNGYAGRRVLEVGCGAGVDLVRFARGGARATGVDVADAAIALARENLGHQAPDATLCVADGERLPFPDDTFDFVYAHGVVQYTANDRALVDECRRVVKPGGIVFFQVYNRVSWLNALSKVMKVGLEHEDAPVLRKYSPGEFRRLLSGFASVRFVPERFPVKSRLHKGWKGTLYNTFFVGTFNAIPRPLVRRFGWHLLAFCREVAHGPCGALVALTWSRRTHTATTSSTSRRRTSAARTGRSLRGRSAPATPASAPTA